MDSKFKIDDIDTDIIQLLTAGKNNREISSTVNVALSTIQRRIRNLIISGLVVQNFQISYEHLGLN
jgi:predicted transcriptional regulator